MAKKEKYTTEQAWNYQLPNMKEQYLEKMNVWLKKENKRLKALLEKETQKNEENPSGD